MQHPLVSHWSRIVQERSYRRESGSVMVTGKNLIQEMARRGRLKRLLTLSSCVDLPADEAVEVTDAILRKVTGLPSCDGFAAEVSMPPPSDLRGIRYLLVLDLVSDPGNVGTLVRTAFALGWEGVVVTPGTADLFNDKALRAAKGATFWLPYQEVTREELLTWPHQLFVADMEGEETCEVEPPVALILSNESRGAREWAQAKSVRIPMRQECESLNVGAAGAILMHQLRGTL
ncbi:MAG: RNA methyltransferase [Verrucomicrobiota bacterium]|nr:RNA methyltransferase [Verrucomicrobiota bacterium]